jgi:hypothetical protein
MFFFVDNGIREKVNVDNVVEVTAYGRDGNTA